MNVTIRRSFGNSKALTRPVGWAWPGLVSDGFRPTNENVVRQYEHGCEIVQKKRYCLQVVDSAEIAAAAQGARLHCEIGRT
jgi:hypothetical protein